MRIGNLVNLALVAVAATALSAAAHGRNAGRAPLPERARVPARVSLPERLDLSAAQQEQVAALRAQLRAALRELGETYRADVEAVFSAEQRAAIEAHRAERRPRRVRPALDLSAEQRAALAELRASYREQRQTLLAEQRAAFEALLTPEQRDLLEELRALRALRAPAGRHRGPGAEGGIADRPAAKAAAAEATSWGRIKSHFGD